MALLSKNYFKTRYTGVYGMEIIKNSTNALGGIKFIAQKVHRNKKWASKYFDTAREAAIAYDLKLIELGMEPVNVLKRK